MPNYFKVTKNDGIGLVEIAGVTLEGEGLKGTSNAAEQRLSQMLKIPVKNVTN